MPLVSRAVYPTYSVYPTARVSEVVTAAGHEELHPLLSIIMTHLPNMARGRLNNRVKFFTTDLSWKLDSAKE